MHTVNVLFYDAGFVMFSVEHPEAPPVEAGCTRISVGSSGIILSLYPGPS